MVVDGRWQIGDLDRRAGGGELPRLVVEADERILVGDIQLVAAPLRRRETPVGGDIAEGEVAGARGERVQRIELTLQHRAYSRWCAHQRHTDDRREGMR